MLMQINTEPKWRFIFSQTNTRPVSEESAAIGAVIPKDESDGARMGFPERQGAVDLGSK